MNKNKIVVEICCGSFEDVKTAFVNGADRVELNSALHLGGLTPTLGSLCLAKKYCDIPVVAMLRPRGSGFLYSEEEYETMLFDLKGLLENGADGIAFGFLKEDFTIDEVRTKEVTDIIHRYGKDAVFHRAFDCSKDLFQATETLISLGVDRILTSGGEATAIEGAEIIKQLVNQYGDRITFVAGAGVRASNAIELCEKTEVKEIHSSCKIYQKDPTCTYGNVDYSYTEKTGEYEVVGGENVKELMEVI